MARTATITRTTSETDISLTLNLDGTGVADIATGIGFLDHMLTALARHGLFDLTVRARGDLHIVFPHSAGAAASVPGASFTQGLGRRRCLGLFGYVLRRSGETNAEARVAVSGSRSLG